MENASKALLMAAGVLMGLMIISLAVYLFANFAGTSSQIHDNIETNQLNQFNSKFTSYVGNDNVTIHDVVTMANLATQNNQTYGFARRSTGEVTGNDYYVQIILNGTRIEYGFGDSMADAEDDYNELILKDVNEINPGSEELKYYTVQVEISEITKRVYKVICND